MARTRNSPPSIPAVDLSRTSHVATIRSAIEEGTTLSARIRGLMPQGVIDNLEHASSKELSAQGVLESMCERYTEAQHKLTAAQHKAKKAEAELKDARADVRELKALRAALRTAMTTSLEQEQQHDGT